MYRFNSLMKALVFGLSLILGGGIGTASFGFDGNILNAGVSFGEPGGSFQCTLIVTSRASQQSAKVNPSASFSFAGGSQWDKGTIRAGAPITVQQLNACTRVQNVRNLVQDGANGTFATDAYMGFTMRAESTVDGLTYDYEIALVGASSTQIVNTQTLVQADTTPPTVTNITRNNPTTLLTNADSLTWTVTFSEAVQNVDAADFTVAGSSATVTGVAGTGATRDITISGGDLAGLNGTVTLGFAGAQNIQDIANNGLTASTPGNNTFDLDNAAPTVTFLNVPTNIAGVTPFTVTVQFSEDVTGFDNVADVAITNGSATTPVQIDARNYAVTITPTGAGDVTIDVLANAAQDTALNGNVLSSVTIASTIVADTQKTIQDFMLTRARQILANRPKLMGFLDGSNTGGSVGKFALTNTGGVQDLVLSTSLNQIKALNTPNMPGLVTTSSSKNTPGVGEFDIWIDIHASRTEVNNATSDFVSGSVGSHFALNPNLLLGMMVQLDYTDENNPVNGSSVTGKGFLVGPYVVGRIPGQNLYYEVRAAWGQSKNDISPLGSFIDEFDTERYLFSARIKGDYALQNGWTISPIASVSYYSETQEAYIDSLTNVIPEQDIALGELSLGPEFSRSFNLDDEAVVQLRLGISAIANFAVESNQTTNTNFSSGDTRARLDFGLGYTKLGGWIVGLDGYYDGLGVSGFEGYGGTVSAKLEF